MALDKNQKIAIGFLIVIFILLFAKGEFKTLAVFPDDYNEERQKFIFPYEYDLDPSGVIQIPDGADLSKIYKLTFSITGCSSKSDVVLNSRIIGSISTPKCKNLFFSDRGDEEPYIHYSTQTLNIFTKTPGALIGYELTRNINYRFSDSFGELTFFVDGEPIFVKEPIISRDLIAWEEVDCRTDANCPSRILFQGKLRDATCNQIFHKCAIGQTYFKPIEPIPPEETKIPWFGIIIIGFLTIMVILVIFYWDKFFKKK